ncbi:MAG: hypothetical protein WD717_00170 [Nitrosarchaeum sp.]
MGKSLGDYMLEQSSLSGTGNIKWTQKNPTDIEKSKKKKTEKRTSSTNIIYTDKKAEPHVEKIFKIEGHTNTELKKEKVGKKFQTSSAFNFKIIPGFSQKGR